MFVFTRQLIITCLVLCLGIGLASVCAEQAHAATVAPASNTGTAAQLFGTIKAPDGVAKYNADPRAAAFGGGFGAMIFVSNLLKLNAIVAGSWSLLNFAQAGLLKIQSADDSGSTKKVAEKITGTIIGLIIIVGSYTLAAIVGLVLFGDPTYILNPTLTGI